MIENFRDDLGRDWLRDQAATVKGKSMPLVQWYGILDEAPKSEWSKHEQATQIALLSRAIAELRAAGVGNVEARIESLRIADAAKFYSTVQELTVASDYLSLGCDVEFVPESADPRPDLLIDGDVEVECKYRVRESPTDVARYKLYDLLAGRVEKALKSSSLNIELSVEAIFRAEPARPEVDEVLDVVRRAVSDEQFVVEARDHGRVAYKVAARPNRDTKMGIGFKISRAWVENYDFIKSTVTMTPNIDGMKFKDPLQVGAKSEVPQDRVKGLTKAFQKAREQFSGTRPALIHVDVTSVLPRLEYAEAERRHKVVNDFLRNNSTVSAIVLEYNDITISPENARAGRRYEIWWNRGARFPMPAGLRAHFEELRVKD